MFYKVEVEHINIYDQRSRRVMIRYKWNRKILDAKLLKIMMMLGVGNLTDVLYIKAILKKKMI